MLYHGKTLAEKLTPNGALCQAAKVEGRLNDSLAAACQARGGITVQSIASDADNPAKIKWQVTPPAGYMQASSDLARGQMAKASYRLAQLLEVLFP